MCHGRPQEKVRCKKERTEEDVQKTIDYIDMINQLYADREKEKNNKKEN